MAQSLSQIYVHIVFSTKNRAALLKNGKFRRKVHAYITGVCGKLDCSSLIVGGAADHVHVLCRLSKTCSVSDLIKELKRVSSKWIKSEDPSLPDFYWQQGYGAFSISPQHVGPLKGYIDNQDEHHEKETFKDELRRLFKKYDVEYDERYVWD